MFMMTMQWAKDQIEALQNKDTLEEYEAITLSALQREVIFLEMINLDEVSIIGRIEDVEARAKQCEIIVLEKGMLDKFKKAYKNQKAITKLINDIHE